MAASRTVVLVTPLTPADTGNGLAMRAGMLLEALAEAADVHLVVVPVSGPATDCSWASARASSVTVVAPVGPATGREHVTRQLADPRLRSRLEATAPLPGRATLVPPTLASEVTSALPTALEPPDAVLAVRTYLAPLGITLAHHLGARRTVVDADDDDGALLRSLGEPDEAAAMDRLAAAWLPDADAVLAASGVDAEGLARHTGITSIGVVPNAVAMPSDVPRAPDVGRLLFLGNLTYEPNLVAARLLAEDIVPRVRARHPEATLDVVGPHDARLADLGGLAGVRLSGAVPDVAPWYRGTDLVVVPLRHGAGTRIKVLEAFAHRRPVVATRTAISGLGARPGRELEIAESAEEIATAVGDLLDDPARRRDLAAAGAELVAARFTKAVVVPRVRAAVFGAAAGQQPGGSAAA